MIYFLQAAAQAGELFCAPHLQSSADFLQAEAHCADPFEAPHLQAFFPAPTGHDPELQQPVKAIVAALNTMSPNNVMFFFIFPPPFKVVVFFPKSHIPADRAIGTDPSKT